MDTSPHNLLGEIGGWLVSGLGIALTGLLTVIGWVSKRQVAQQDDHGRRISALEREQVTKGDITAVYERIEEVGKQMNENHTDTMKILIDRLPGK